MDRGAWQLQSMGSQRVGHDLATKQHIASGICFSFHWLPALQDGDGDVGGDEGRDAVERRQQ